MHKPTTIPFPSPRTDDAVAFLEAFHPSGPWHLVAILDNYIAGHTFTDYDPMRRWIDQHQGHHNIYFHVNALKNTPKQPQALKTEVAAALYLHTDIDDPSDATLERLRNYTPAPTAIIFSGGGYQAFWELTEPCGHLDRVEACNQELARMLGGDNCHNINRIMRLPGTINVLSQEKRKRGRAPALATVVEADWARCYTLEQFPVRAQARPATTTVVLPDDVPLLGADNVPGLSDATRTLLREGDDPERPRGKPKPHYKSRSEALFGAVTALVRADCDNVTIAGLILNPELKISGSVLDKPKPKDYARKQISHARAAVEATEAFPDLGKNGWPRPSLPNTKVALAKLGVECRHDLFKLRYAVDGHEIESFVGEVSDPALLRLREMIYERFGFDASTQTVHTAVQTLANHHRFHPVRDYLDGLKWDGVPRVDNWLISYGGAKDSEYVRAVGALVLTAAVRRVREPGCKFDEILVLENEEQGTNKSQALQVLAVQREWFSDNLPLGLSPKETIEALSGHWIVEASELHGMRNSEIEKVKAFASRDTDRARMSYDRAPTEARRQCVIIGTTNSKKYLRDRTGNRRFWPVGVERFDLEALKRDRDQLWAEAAAREASGASIRLPEKLWAEAAKEQLERMVENPFVTVLEHVLREPDEMKDGVWVEGPPMEGKITAEDMWTILEVKPAQRTQDKIEAFGDAMKQLGWERTRWRVGGRDRAYFYFRGNEPHKRINVCGRAEGSGPTAFYENQPKGESGKPGY